MRRLVTIAAFVAAALAPAGRAARAQGSVGGRLALTDRPNAPRSRLADAVVYLEPARGASAAEHAPETASISMHAREFDPHVQVVAVGGSVAFPNDDPFSHNVFSNAEAGPFDLGLYRRGASRSATFPRTGVYPVYCNIHSRMVSFVIAVPSPLVAMVAADGRFTFTDVPPGTYLLHAWHERANGRVAREIVVPATGVSGQRIVLDTRANVSGPHLNKFGLPYAATREDRY